jgi:hypothetical protein
VGKSRQLRARKYNNKKNREVSLRLGDDDVKNDGCHQKGITGREATQGSMGRNRRRPRRVKKTEKRE